MNVKWISGRTRVSALHVGSSSHRAPLTLTRRFVDFASAKHLALLATSQHCDAIVTHPRHVDLRRNAAIGSDLFDVQNVVEEA